MRGTTTFSNNKFLILYPILLCFILYQFVSLPTFLFHPIQDRRRYASQLTSSITPYTTANSQWYVNAIQIPIPSCNQTSGEICETYDPNMAHVPCSEVPSEFRSCRFVHGSCKRYGNTAYKQVSNGILNCTVNAGIDCIGDTNFLVFDYPCRFRNGVHFTTVLVTSMFVGVFGVDRFCLGFVCCGIVKLFTLGGVGVWWFIDLVLLFAGVTQPEDGSTWELVY